MRLLSLAVIICLLVTLLGCATVKDRGTYYLESEQYEAGIKAFKKVLSQNPKDLEANYYLGRFYLAEDKPERALPFLRRAAEPAPHHAEYCFWLGVGYWAVRDFDAERMSYWRALAVDPNYLPARLYLGNNYLDGGQWKMALRQYDRVLSLDPYNPEALYDRGLALQQAKRVAEEVDAWKRYLKHYPDGRWALRAVDHLNELGDFSYRNFTIGYRRVPLAEVAFASGSAKAISRGKSSLDVIGSILKVNEEIQLEIVAYLKGNSSGATARAGAVRDWLLTSFPTIQPSRLKARGEGSPEKVETGNRTYFLDQSVSFVTTKK
jgi:tetratricopeptide (TPR) repeat protein